MGDLVPNVQFFPISLAFTILWISLVRYHSSKKAATTHLCTLGVDWDDTLPSDLCSKRDRLKRELPRPTSIQIPRLLDLDFTVSIQLKAFCDISEAGYAAVVYLRSQLSSSVSVKFFMAKSKVAPLKRCSIPRLELCAAVLYSGLVSFVRNTYNSVTFDRVVA